MTDDLIERAAAAHYAASTDSRVELAWEACHPMYRAQQARAMQSALQAIHDEGFAVVPRSALMAAIKLSQDGRRTASLPAIGHILTDALIVASQPKTEGGET